MNDKIINDSNQEDDVAKKLDSIAVQINANPYFVSELEQNLMEKRQPKRNWALTLNQFSTALGWIVLIIAFGFILNWSFKALIPMPQPATNVTSTPTLSESIAVTNTTTPDIVIDGYDWRETTLYLAQPLPESPVDANVYVKKYTAQATREDVLALAHQFGMEGELYETRSQFTGELEYIINDGNRKLQVSMDHQFTYHSNFGGQIFLDNLSEERARSIADEFLKKNGFEFKYRFERAPDMQGMHFHILPLIQDAYEMRFDYMRPIQYEIILDNTGENIIFFGYLIEYETIGNFGIITAEDAFQKILDPNPQTGVMESFRGQGGGGGGSSFLKINLSGTPAVFPSPTPTIPVETPIVEYDPAFTPPTATIEIIELAYYVRYPPYALADPSAGIQYVQPVWRFYGHYSNGDEFEILVQALKEDYLLPELAPYTPPG